MRLVTVREYFKQQQELERMQSRQEPVDRTNYRKAYERILNYCIEHDLLSPEEIERFRKKLL